MSLTAPPVNTPVTVDVVGWSAPRRSRIEDLGDEVVVAAPVLAPGLDHEPSLGSLLELVWQGRRGPESMEVRLVAKEHGKIDVWRLAPAGPVVVRQRRNHVRAGTLLPVALATSDGRIEARVVDLSEGGIRAVHHAGAAVTVGERVVVELTLGDRELVLRSDVVRVASEGAQQVAGCRFTDIDRRDADALRRYVFARQTRDRVR